MDKIRIITDSASDFSGDGRDDVTVLPMTVSFGEEQYQDGITISHREFYAKLIESDQLPATSLIAPSAFEEAYRRAERDGEEVVVITLSSRLSGTYQSAVMAAGRYADRVFVVDSMNATIGEQILVRLAIGMMDDGIGAEQIARELEKAKLSVHTVGLLDTLEYLKKGGRISKTVAFVGGALNIKPVVAVRDGEVVLLGKARGSHNGCNYLVKEIEKANGVDFSKPFCLGYTGLDDTMLKKYVDDSRAMWAEHTENLPVCTIGATIGTHVGPNAIAVAFFAQK